MDSDFLKCSMTTFFEEINYELLYWWNGAVIILVKNVSDHDFDSTVVIQLS